MTTNLQETPPSRRPDQQVGIEPTPASTSSATSTGVKGVAVYDRGSDSELDSSTRPSASTLNDSAPATTQSSGNMIAWIIGIVLLIIIAYFILQMFF